MRDFFKWFIVCLALWIAFVLFIGTAFASYNAFRVHCDSLVGSGEVVIWFNDEVYKVPVVCK